MELLLAARSRQNVDRIVASVGAADSVGTLGEELARHLGVDVKVPSLQVGRTGELLHSEAQLGEVDLISGDEVIVVESPQRRVSAMDAKQALLILRTGPQAGSASKCRVPSPLVATILPTS